MSAELTRLLAEIDAILLDFDGPLCSVFAGYPAPEIAAELVELLQRQGVPLPPRLTSETDPLEVLRWTGTTGSPEPVLRAVSELGIRSARAALVGDSRSDLQAGRAAGVRTIGYAIRPAKVGTLREAGADIVIDSMGPLAAGLLDETGQ